MLNFLYFLTLLYLAFSFKKLIKPKIYGPQDIQMLGTLDNSLQIILNIKQSF